MILSNGYRFLLLVLILLSVSFVINNPLNLSQFGPKSDEGYYFSYAKLVQEKGILGFKDLLNWYNTSPEAQLHPIPTRIGYILLTSVLFNLFGASFSILGALSTLSFVLFLGVSFYYFRKIFDIDRALLITTILSSSPLLLGLSRRALIDSPLNLLWGILFFLFLDLILKPDHYRYFFFIVFMTLAVTFKEMSLILIPIFMGIALWCHRKEGRINNNFIIGLIIWPSLSLISIYIFILGGYKNCLIAANDLIKMHLTSHYVNYYAYAYSSGPWYRYIVDFLLLNPIVTLLSVGFLGVSLVIRNKLDFKIKYLIFFFISIFGILSLLPHSKVVRFVLNLELGLSIMAVWMLIDIFKTQDIKALQRRVVFCVVLIYLINWNNFLQIFFITGLLDPISYHLLVLKNFIPG